MIEQNGIVVPDSYKIKISDIPEMVGVNVVLAATMSKNKVNTQRALYQNFNSPVDSQVDQLLVDNKDPEKDYGVKESESINPVEVSKDKADTVVRFTKFSESQDPLIHSGDVVMAVWRFGDDPDQIEYSYRGDRGIDLNDPIQVESALEKTEKRAVLLYCNGVFYASWQIGLNVQRPKQEIERKVGIRVLAELNPLTTQDVRSRLSLKDNSMVNLIAEAPMARKITIKNRAQGKQDEIEIDGNSELLRLLVMGCGLPHELMKQLMSVDTPVLPDGTSLLDFSKFGTIARKRE